MSKKMTTGKLFDPDSIENHPIPPKAKWLDTNGTASSFPTNAIESRLQAWVKSVEKDTEEKVQEYLEQSDAGQSGE